MNKINPGVDPAAAQGPAAAGPKIGHIFVIFEESRSFDNIFGLFPDANASTAPRRGRSSSTARPAARHRHRCQAASCRHALFQRNCRTPRSGSTNTYRRTSRPAIWCTASIRNRPRSTMGRWIGSPPCPTPAVWSWAITISRPLDGGGLMALMPVKAGGKA